MLRCDILHKNGSYDKGKLYKTGKKSKIANMC